MSVSILSHVLKALIDCGASINLINESVCSLLSIPVTPCQGPRVTLADGATTLSCSGIVTFRYSLSDISLQDTFFVAPLGVQSIILGMPFLERENPLIDWKAKSLEWRPKAPSISSSLPVPAASSAPPPTPPLTPPLTPQSHHDLVISSPILHHPTTKRQSSPPALSTSIPLPERDSRSPSVDHAHEDRPLSSNITTQCYLI